MVGSTATCPLCSTGRFEAAGPATLAADDDSGRAAISLAARYMGRSAALSRLRAAVDRTCETGRLSFALIVGEHGMGKTSTVAELARRSAAEHPDLRFLLGAGRPAGAAYAPFAELLSARFGSRPGIAADETRERIAADVARVMPAARVTETAHLIAHLMRVPFPDSPVLGPLADSPQQLEARSFLALRRFFTADAAAAPLLLCLENLEAFSAESINLLHYLVAGLAHARVIVVGTARPALFERHPATGKLDVAIERVDLGPLEPDEAEAILRELCRPLGAVSPRLLEHAARLGGSPRALIELVHYLFERRLIVAGQDEWRADQDALAEAALPATHEELVAERVLVMAPVDRDLIEMAAVVGETFWLDAVVALVRVRDQEGGDPDGPTLTQIAAAGDAARDTAAQVMNRLVEREWIARVEPSTVAGEPEYRFAYPYLWSAVYEGIDPGLRRAAHRIVAQYLELRPEGRGAAAQEEIAGHLELGGDLLGASARYRRAADFARASFFNDRAVRLYLTSLACLGEADLATRIHLWHDLGSVYELVGEYEEALEAFERMLRLAWVCASRTKAAVAFNKMGRVWRRKGDIKLALEYLERGLELFEQAGDRRGVAGSLDDVGSVLHLLGRTDEAYDSVSRALSALGRAGERRSRARSLSNLGNIERDRGRFAESYACHHEALDLLAAIGDRAGVIASRGNLAVLAAACGDRPDARRGWELALEEAEAIGALPLQALALCNLGELAVGDGRSEEARHRLDEAQGIAREIADRRIEGEATRNLALLEYEAGDAARARELAARAHAVAADAGLRDNEGRALVTLGQVFAARALLDTGAADAGRERAEGEAIADGYFARGIELLRGIGNEAELARGLERYGRHKLESGAADAGRDLLREALAIFDRLGLRDRAELEAMLAV